VSQQADKLRQDTFLPWYRQFWPWFLIALPASAVIASLYSLYLAVTHPDPVIIDQQEYRQLDRELKVQRSATQKPRTAVSSETTAPADPPAGH
jgi:hypothetical protein